MILILYFPRHKEFLVHGLVVENLISHLSRHFATLRRPFSFVCEGFLWSCLCACYLALLPTISSLLFKFKWTVQLLTSLSIFISHFCHHSCCPLCAVSFPLLFVANSYRYFKAQFNGIFSRKLFLINWSG